MAGPTSRGSVVRTFLIADVRGYTVFTNEHGDEAAAELASRFAEVAKACIEAREGAARRAPRRRSARGVRLGAPGDPRRGRAPTPVRGRDDRRPDAAAPGRIGLDAGEAVPVGDGYRGGALNLAARLCSVAGPAEDPREPRGGAPRAQGRGRRVRRPRADDLEGPRRPRARDARPSRGRGRRGRHRVPPGARRRGRSSDAAERGREPLQGPASVRGDRRRRFLRPRGARRHPDRAPRPRRGSSPSSVRAAVASLGGRAPG